METDVRRRVVGVATGATRLLNEVQASLDDVMGALDSDDLELAAFEARILTMGCLSVQSLQLQGEPHAFFGDLATFDPYSGLPDEVVLAANRWAAAVLEDGSIDVAEWLAGLQRLVRETEAVLQLSEPLPELRSPEGLFTVMRMARDWLSATEALGLPGVLPAEWTGSA